MTIKKVVVVDDSKSMCQFLTRIIDTDPSLKVVGCANDPHEARAMIKELAPDVITLDVEMPKMDGITFLANLMRLHPMPVVMISSLTAAGAKVTLEALRLGALDFLVKRHPGKGDAYDKYVFDIVQRIKFASRTDVKRPATVGRSASRLPDFLGWRKKLRPLSVGKLKYILAIGASTGGPVAVQKVLESCNTKGTAVLLSQHMPAHFTAAFAARLNKFSDIDFAEAKNGDLVEAGRGYLAPGDSHLTIVRTGSDLHCRLRHSPPINGHQPSVDTMFESVATVIGRSAIGVLLTGMGTDGAAGLGSLQKSGGVTFAQDEHTSAVWGMPGSAVKADAADGVLPLQDIAPTFNELVS